MDNAIERTEKLRKIVDECRLYYGKETQKAGATARFGARYGVSVRRRAGSAISKKSRVYTCPSCHYRKVRRKSAGIWNAESVVTHSLAESGSLYQS